MVRKVEANGTKFKSSLSLPCDIIIGPLMIGNFKWLEAALVVFAKKKEIYVKDHSV